MPISTRPTFKPDFAYHKFSQRSLQLTYCIKVKITLILTTDDTVQESRRKISIIFCTRSFFQAMTITHLFYKNESVLSDIPRVRIFAPNINSISKVRIVPRKCFNG